MMDRLEELFDRAVDASLREVANGNLREQLRKYLADAHAIEAQAESFLERGISLSEGTSLAPLYERHLTQTEGHSKKIEQRLEALGGDPSSLKDGLMRAGALHWAEFFHGHPDTPGKLAVFSFAFEHLEIGAYEQLRRVADRAGDQQTAVTVGAILAEERAAADAIRSSFDEAVDAALEAQGVTA